MKDYYSEKVMRFYAVLWGVIGKKCITKVVHIKIKSSTL